MMHSHQNDETMERHEKHHQHQQLHELRARAPRTGMIRASLYGAVYGQRRVAGQHSEMMHFSPHRTSGCLYDGIPSVGWGKRLERIFR